MREPRPTNATVDEGDTSGYLLGVRARWSALSVTAWMGLAALAGATMPEVPWPRGQAPTPTVLEDKVSDAVELFELEREEEFLEASEAGEDSEHIFVLQEDIDKSTYSVERLFLARREQPVLRLGRRGLGQPRLAAMRAGDGSSARAQGLGRHLITRAAMGAGDDDRRCLG